jgi:hypothetical protein
MDVDEPEYRAPLPRNRTRNQRQQRFPSNSNRGAREAYSGTVFAVASAGKRDKIEDGDDDDDDAAAEGYDATGSDGAADAADLDDDANFRRPRADRSKKKRKEPTESTTDKPGVSSAPAQSKRRKVSPVVPKDAPNDNVMIAPPPSHPTAPQLSRTQRVQVRFAKELKEYDMDACYEGFVAFVHGGGTLAAKSRNKAIAALKSQDLLRSLKQVQGQPPMTNEQSRHSKQILAFLKLLQQRGIGKRATVDEMKKWCKANEDQKLIEGWFFDAARSYFIENENLYYNPTKDAQ